MVPAFQESLLELRKICVVKKVLPKPCTPSESLLGCVYEGAFDASKVRVRRVKAFDPDRWYVGVVARKIR